MDRQTTFEQADKYHGIGQLPEAEALYRQLIEQHPDFADAWYRLGMIAQQTGMQDVAADLIGQAISLNAYENEQLLEAQLRLIRCLLEIGDFPKAEQEALLLLQNTPAPLLTAYITENADEQRLALDWLRHVSQKSTSLQPENTPAPSQNRIATQEREGTSIAFYVPNKITLWRAERLFNKEPDTIEWIRTFRNDDVFIDIGANVGSYAIWASLSRGVQTYAFEPEAQNYALLNRNIALNKINDKVVAYCMALGNSPRFALMYIQNMNAGGSGTPSAPKLATISILSVRHSIKAVSAQLSIAWSTKALSPSPITSKLT